MTPSQQVKLFARQHGMKVDSQHGVVTISKNHAAGAMWIECFDNYKQAYAFLSDANEAYVIHRKEQPWNKPNYK